ncbi:ubiquitin-like protein 4a [Plakobranchus ocellatus]|uniref:Ubiquitin-like protein 4a n=1 Tax=Plakobranchus ocellatus TaxID=259542 RepID=A0AAV4BV06_9GAST|nr:ubiquitin-like protein 4a [Plakobranchus ocellatus]
MHLTVKILNGQECVLAASPCSLVSDVKEQVEALLSIPVTDQKLLFKGKALMDAKPLRDYGVEDCAKITLVIKKSSTKPVANVPSVGASAKPAPSNSVPQRPVWEKLRMFLRRHFREKDAEVVLLEFQKEFERNLSTLSLDDIERLALTKLRQQ